MKKIKVWIVSLGTVFFLIGNVFMMLSANENAKKNSEKTGSSNSSDVKKDESSSSDKKEVKKESKSQDEPKLQEGAATGEKQPPPLETQETKPEEKQQPDSAREETQKTDNAREEAPKPKKEVSESSVPPEGDNGEASGFQDTQNTKDEEKFHSKSLDLPEVKESEVNASPLFESPESSKNGKDLIKTILSWALIILGVFIILKVIISGSKTVPKGYGKKTKGRYAKSKSKGNRYNFRR